MGQNLLASVSFPHCDARILHSPGTCTYCDAHPEWQNLRKTWGVAFSGEAPKVGQVPCPHDQAFGVMRGYDVSGKEIVEDRDLFRSKVAAAREFWTEYLNGNQGQEGP